MNPKIYLLFILFGLQAAVTNAYANSTVLKPGEVALTGFNAGNGDLAFVSFVKLAPGTKICFTNNGWNSSAGTTTAKNARNVEEIATWSNSTQTTIEAGTVITMSTASPYTTNIGTTTVYSNTVATNAALLIQNGDQVTIYQPTGSGNGFAPANNVEATFTGTAIGIVHWPFNYAINGAITNETSYLPADLVSYNLVGFNTYLNPYLHYTGARTNKTIEQYRADLYTKSNWQNNWFNPLNATAFSITGTLPVTLSDFSATAGTGNIQLSWQAENETNVNRYEIELSHNGTVFNKLASVTAAQHGSASQNYRYQHTSVASTVVYYRLKTIDNDGSFVYSQVVRVMAKKQSGQVTVRPNPVLNQKMNLELEGLVAGKYDVIVTNAAGNVVYKQMLQNTGGIFNVQVQLPNVTPGVYNVQLSSGATFYNTRALVR